MAVVSAREILLKATREKYSVGAFNITNFVQMEAVVEAAERKKAPLIIQTSVTPTRFLKAKHIVAVYHSLAKSASIPICLHLDHCTDIELCKAAADAGYTNVMIDASKQDFEENVRQTKLVADYCHSLGDITVEGELGTVCGVEDQVKIAEDEAALCDPDKAEEFVQRTDIELCKAGKMCRIVKKLTYRMEVNGHGVPNQQEKVPFRRICLSVFGFFRRKTR